MPEKCIHGFVQEMLLGGQFGSKPIADNYRTKEASILIDQAGLERRNLSASAYKVVGRTKGMFHHCPAVYYFSMPDESILVHFRVGLLVDFMLFFWRCGGLPPTQAQA
ncbi:unnamed protein product [Wuchereria bancrofti]|uniref:Uncharacterized protein n=1 Tax=Wuchereria bancrofti TaxID=6293 RepID=A0A3P7E0Y3_WUCBA|nr:unnamed protein product [Wuchereria bancrofti]